ncbi:phosphoesterase PA-phosphatase related protein [Pseudopedobacter saltans DSM 12145]|uniref:Phosphoesterase PA-phosphatase related protein n=1 Tax=Pseudopedobacter saltans (strain ATCC 51119 / DSM 12145 / JCM 21818 / CCUG 39354 / LMG 10337 / NBRC 100064 / NCIMB 13643) TaxID=762903 RepID=F0SAK8_PSESL|nr:phosphatase PAP2 family protein [Pseudopedobacter saltans]ADY52628.1 phosphoesterase PA-phosphatase related protein [Pseudopedobacter saltans DSM 12145]
MINQLLHFDQEVFFFVNKALGNAFFDWLMPILRNKYTWIPLYIFIIAFSVGKYKLKGFYLILFLSATVGLADFTSAKLLKPTFERVRPCNDETIKDQVNARVGCGAGKSFPSTHATDHFAIAMFLIGIFRRIWKHIIAIGILWAGLISFAQVYVGVHYPIDVTVGALYGSLIGFLLAKIYKRYFQLEPNVEQID